MMQKAPLPNGYISDHLLHTALVRVLGDVSSDYPTGVDV